MKPEMVMSIAALVLSLVALIWAMIGVRASYDIKALEANLANKIQPTVNRAVDNKMREAKTDMHTSLKAQVDDWGQAYQTLFEKQKDLGPKVNELEQRINNKFDAAKVYVDQQVQSHEQQVENWKGEWPEGQKLRPQLNDLQDQIDQIKASRTGDVIRIVNDQLKKRGAY